MEAEGPPGIVELIEYEAAIEAAMADRRRYDVPLAGTTGGAVEAAAGAPPDDREPPGTLPPPRT